MSLLSYFLKLYPAGPSTSADSNHPSQARGSDPAADEDVQRGLTVAPCGDGQVEEVAGGGSAFEVVRPIRASTGDGDFDPFGDVCA
jgi:hypothetical protein